MQQKYKDELQIYLGVEEDAFGLIDKNRFDYIIGSAHYVRKENQYYPVDLDSATLKECINLFDNNMLAFADAYYRDFCEYIKYRKPNIIGHFDLITKFDEMESSIFLQNPKYNELAEKYIRIAAENDCIFEVNTGAISRGYRKTPYPSENLLHVLKTLNAKIMLTSDSHSADTLDFGYEETTTHLKDIGFTSAYTLLDNEFKKYDL